MNDDIMNTRHVNAASVAEYCQANDMLLISRKEYCELVEERRKLKKEFRKLADMYCKSKQKIPGGWYASCENCEHAYRGADPLNIIQDSKYLFYCSAGHGYGGAETVCCEWKMKEGDNKCLEKLEN